MEPPYSFLADWLSKFHTWPMLIQALWLVTVPAAATAVLLGLPFVTLRGIRDIAAVLRGPAPGAGAKGRPLPDWASSSFSSWRAAGEPALGAPPAALPRLQGKAGHALAEGAADPSQKM